MGTTLVGKFNSEFHTVIMATPPIVTAANTTTSATKTGEHSSVALSRESLTKQVVKQHWCSDYYYNANRYQNTWIKKNIEDEKALLKAQLAALPRQGEQSQQQLQIKADSIPMQTEVEIKQQIRKAEQALAAKEKEFYRILMITERLGLHHLALNFSTVYKYKYSMEPLAIHALIELLKIPMNYMSECNNTVVLFVLINWIDFYVLYVKKIQNVKAIMRNEDEPACFAMFDNELKGKTLSQRALKVRTGTPNIFTIILF